MAETGTFVTTWQDKIGDRWHGYYEPAEVCWKEGPEKQEALPSGAVPNLKMSNLKIENVDINGDGLPDRFELAETNDAWQVKLFRCAKTQNSSGCGGGYTISEGVGFEKKGLVLKAVTKEERLDAPAIHRVAITEMVWQKAKPTEKISGRLIVSGLDLWGKDPTAKLRWEIAFENCPPPPSLLIHTERLGGCGL